MKTNKNYLLILSLAFLLFACGSGEENNETTNEDGSVIENSDAGGDTEANMPEIDLSNVSQDCLDRLDEYDAFLAEFHEFKETKYNKDKEKYFDEYMDYISENSSWGSDDKLVACSDDMNFLNEMFRIKAKYMDSE